jgi:hypothetical protein
MAGLLHWLQSCFEDENENQENASYEPPRPPAPAQMVRYESTLQANEDEKDDDGDCCRPESGESENGLHVFWRTLRDRWKAYESLEPIESGDAVPPRFTNDNAPFRGTTRMGMFSRTSNGSKPPASPLLTSQRSPLRTASSFRHSGGIPAIAMEEVVLPGSVLQLQMAQSMSGTLEEQGDECVICLEGFDASNPRMPTLCGCGENKTYFHLPCLYQWLEQSNECPSCRKRLRWEEF